MNKFPLSHPPSTAGVYALRNKKTGHIYVGQSKNLHKRLLFWKDLFRRKIGMASADFLGVVRETAIQDWEFRVLLVVDVTQLDRIEQRAINRIKDAKTATCLNKNFVAKPDCVIYPSSRSVVLGVSGPMSHQQVADALGIKRSTAAGRVKYHRQRGRSRLTLDDLRLRDDPLRPEVYKPPTLKPF